MAFYNKKVSKNKLLMKAWRAGHQIKLDDDEEICLPEICDEIGDWVRRDRHPRNRLSLRSFAVLLDGAIRLYKDEIDKLYDDTCNEFKSKVRSRSLILNNDQYNDDDELSGEASTVFTVCSDDKPPSTNYTETTEKAVQTSPTLGTKRDVPISHSFDPKLPFGCVFIHKNCDCRIPTKILYSSLNENV